MAGQTNSKEVSRTLETLRNVDATVIGAVLNGATAESGYGYGYYTEEPAKGRRRGSRADRPAAVES
jgi:Mrp family chromosome partitioning ATPase